MKGINGPHEKVRMLVHTTTRGRNTMANFVKQGTPILKLEMVKKFFRKIKIRQRFRQKKIHQKNLSKKSSKQLSKEFVINLSKNFVQPQGTNK